jgi:hypothetical protein
MPGILGLTYRAADLTEADQTELARGIALAKTLRDLQREAAGRLLTAQASPDGPAWDVLQELNAATGEIVVYAFQNDGATPAVAVLPRGLTAGAKYTIATVDGEPLGSMTAEEIAAGGVTIDESPLSAARVLVLRPDRPPAAAPRSINRAKRDE